MAETRKNQLDIEQILIAALHRWLRPTEICEIIRNNQLFDLGPAPPDKPSSGSLFLYNRNVVGHFRQDGHYWRKEAHERIKVGSIDVLNCYYTHGEENENFQRSCYWMLEKEFSHLCLVHYLQVKRTDQKFYSDLVHDHTSRSREQAVDPNDLRSPKPFHAYHNMQNDLHVQLSNAEHRSSLKAYLKFVRQELSISPSVSSEEHSSHLSNWPTDQKLCSDSAHNLTSRGHHDEPMHAAAIRIQTKFRSWKGRKDFLIIREKIVKIQAHVRGLQVRKSYKMIVWSVGILEKAILRRRQEGTSLPQFKAEALIEGSSSMLNTYSKEDDFDLLKEGRKMKDERLKKIRAPIMSIVQLSEARDQYPFNGNTLIDNYQGKFSLVPGADLISLAEADKSKVANDALTYEIQKNLDYLGTTSTQSVNVVSESIIDYTHDLPNYKVFKSKDELIQWTREFGKKKGFEIVTKRSDLGNRGPRPRITLCCERGGQYKKTQKIKEGKKEQHLRNPNTKKCGCPFTLKGRKLNNDDNWWLEVVCGVHNHPITKPLEGRSHAGRLSKEEKLLLINMSKSEARPKDILATLKNKDINNTSTIKHIYNGRRRSSKVIEKFDRSQIQHLVSKLSEYKYVEWHRSFDNSDIIKDLLWAHPVSIDLLRAFPRVLVMDAYKTNRSNLPLLEIEGMTSTNIPFVVAFAYLESEQEENYLWALEKLRSVMDDNALPTVILSGKELALMNAITRVFPTTQHLLHRWYISKNISANCKKLFAINEIREKFIMRWNEVVLSSSEDKFTHHLNVLKQEFSSYPEAIEYVTNTWLNNYREQFVSAWANKILHFGALTKDRVGSSHPVLKKHLHFSQGNFETSWAKIHSLLELQHTNIRASLAKSLAVVQDQFKSAEFKELRGFISRNALHMNFDESKRANFIGVDASTCGCIIRRTHGLPCAHEIAEFKRESRPIPLESIDSYWRKLDLVPVSNKQNAKLSYESVLDLIAKRFHESDEGTKFQILQKLIEIANPLSTSLKEPNAKKETHGRPNSKGDKSTPRDSSTFEGELSERENLLPTSILKTVAWGPISQVKENIRPQEEVHRNKRHKSDSFVNSFPVGLQPYIHDIKDVAADGNCGFRAIADLMGFGENEWLRVREDLLNELNSNLKYYRLLYGSEERVEELKNALSYFGNGPVGCDKWMIMPEMGHLIASTYNVVLFHFSLQQCLSFLPLRSVPVLPDSRKTIAIGFVNNNHFVEVFLSPGHPIPPIASNWHKFHYPCAEGWVTVYNPRIQQLEKIIGNEVATNEIIDIDSSSFIDDPVQTAAV